MPDPADEIRRLLDLLRRGDEKAASLLVTLVYERYRRLTSQMLRGYPALRRLGADRRRVADRRHPPPPGTENHEARVQLHFHNLTARHIRFALIDLVRHNLGPQGHGKNHHTDGAGKAADDKRGSLDRHRIRPTNPPRWKSGPPSTRGSMPCPQRNGRSSTSSGTRDSNNKKRHRTERVPPHRQASLAIRPPQTRRGLRDFGRRPVIDEELMSDLLGQWEDARSGRGHPGP